MILAIVNTTSNFVYAEESSCAACTTTSPYIDNYIAFGYELISALQTYANDENSVFQTATNNTTSTQWQSQTTTTNEGSRTLQAIADNLNKKAQSLASAWFVASLITVEAVFLDSRKSVGVLFQSEAIMRDWQKVDRLDQSITNTLLDLWNAWVFVRLWFKAWFKERIVEILKKYNSGDNPVIDINPDTYSTQPANILWALRRMNQNIKTLISFGNLQENDEKWNTAYIIDHTFLDGQLSFSQAFKDAIGGNGSSVWYYSCAKSVKWLAACSTIGKQGKAQMDAIAKDTKSQVKDAKTTIQNSILRLSWFWAKNGNTWAPSKAKEALEARQRELLRWQYWWKWVSNSDGLPLVQWFWDAYKSVKNNITSTGGPLNGLSTKKPETPQAPFVVWSIANTINSKKWREKFIAVAASTTSLAATERQQSLLWDTSPVTKVFPIITAELTKAQYTIEWNAANTIINNLWKACELQCSNVWGRCWYDQ